MSLDQKISAKFTQVDSLIVECNEKNILSVASPTLIEIISLFKEIISVYVKNIDFLNNPLIDQDFQQVLHIIDISEDAIIQFLTFITNHSGQDEQIISRNMTDLHQCFQIFFANLQQIINKYSNSEPADTLYQWLGLECILFTFCVNIQLINEFPFFTLKIVNFYKSYEKVNLIESPVSAVTSFCGTGKTTCLPIMLLCRSLKEGGNPPFIVHSIPEPIQIENFFRERLSKFVKVVTNKEEFSEDVNNYINNRQPFKKLILGVFSPFEVLSLISMNSKSIEFTRYVIDEIHLRPFFSDVLIAKIAEFNESNMFTFSMNVILVSSSISSSLLLPFKSTIEVNSFCENSQYEIVEKPPIYDHFIKKIKSEIVPEQTIEIINKMAVIGSQIEEGHVLCFLPGLFVCEQAKKAVVTQLSSDEETETKRKVVFLKSALKHNESLDHFYGKLREEYEFNEKLREVDSKHEFLYFLPLCFSGLSDDSLLHLVKDEMPADLKKINKLVFSTSLSEPSINDKLSVVVDSGLVKENAFDYSISLRTIKDIQASKEIMHLRKGRLGRSMKGLYVPIQMEKNIPDVQTPSIQREDMSKDILLLKSIGIDIEKVENLPDKPIESSLKTALDNLVYIGAIDEKTQKITDFGREILRFPFIRIYYSAAMHLFKNDYEDDEKDVAFFVAAYISTVLTMSNILVQEEMSEKLSKLFVKESDIATIINALNILLKSTVTDNDELRNLVESYGFSYSVFRELKENIQLIINVTFPGKEINEVFEISNEFIENHEGLVSVIDTFILSIEQTYPSFTDSNYITFKCVNGSGGFDSHSSLIFKASENLRFPKKRQQFPEIAINRRPGWNGICIPTECYLFNITRNLNYNTNSGYLIHRATSESTNLISTIEVDKIAMNPYFGILLEIYFKDLGLTYFENDSKDPASKHSYPFHYSNAGDRVFVSFISNYENLKEVIEKGAEKVIKLLPYTPRSVLILRGDGNAIVEVTSLGTSDYNTSIATMSNGNLLDKKSIDYCANNLDELAKLDSRIRICSLFFNESCKPQYFDEDNLYIINENIKNNFDYPLFDIVIQRLQEFNKEVKQKQLLMRRYVTESHNKKKEKLTLFQFPLDFIHPSLIRYQESLNCIVKWLDKSMQIKVFDVVGSRLLMRTNDVERLKLQIHNEREAMKEQLNLNYVAIQVPMKIYEKNFITIKEHHTWHYDKKYRAIVTTKEESSDVEHLIENSNDNDNDNVTSFIENELPSKVLCCYYSCENPEDPILTKYPLSVFFKDGSYYISKACRGCLIDNLRFHLGYLFVKGMVDQKKVEGIMVRPDGIPTVKSVITKEGTESWPVIPLGLLVYVLINDDDEELSAYLSAWLYSIEEFTIRVMMQTRFLWCSHHPHVIYDIVKLGQRRFHCKECDNELESLQLDEEEAERRREEIRQRDIQNEIFQKVENRIRKLVDDQLKSQKVKRRADEEERIRREIEGKVRFENEERIRKDVIKGVTQREARRRKEEEERRKQEEERRKYDEFLRRKEEERKRKEELRIQKLVDAFIARLVERNVLIEEAQNEQEVSPERRIEIEAEIRKNEEQIRIDIIAEEKRKAEEERKRRDVLNIEKSLDFINTLKRCPKCHNPIIKNGGCNHMFCKCGCHFCWLCGFQSNNTADVHAHLNKKHGGLFD